MIHYFTVCERQFNNLPALIAACDVEATEYRQRRCVEDLESKHMLGLVQINRRATMMEFTLDAPALYNGYSYKGFVYSATVPKGRMLASLDRYRKTSEDLDEAGNYQVYKAIKDSWYLSLRFVVNP